MLENGKHILSTLLVTSLLSACGSSSSDSDSEPGGAIGAANQDWQAIDLNAFNNRSSGVWATEITINTPFETSITYGGEELTNTANVDSIMVSLDSFDNQGSNGLYADHCEVEGSELFEADDDNEGLEELFVEMGSCDSPVSNFFVSSQNEDAYKLEVRCGNELLASFVQAKISDEITFDHGSVSFQSDYIENLGETNEVCGSISSSRVDNRITPQPNILNIEDSVVDRTSFVIGAPYQGEKLIIEFDYEGNLSTGVHSVVSWYEDDQENAFAVELGSYAFGGSSSYASWLTASGGSVTIDSISATSVSGSFDLEMETGGSIQGSFSLDI